MTVCLGLELRRQAAAGWGSGTQQCPAVIEVIRMSEII